MQKTVALSIDETVVTLIDETRGDVPRSRIVERALRDYLNLPAIKIRQR
jgi:metal-responsive CopG/Arc/MetJ family transcriptional regulator